MKKIVFILTTLVLLTGCFLTESRKNLQFENIEKFLKKEGLTTDDLNLGGSVRSIMEYGISANDTFLDVGLILEENPEYRLISADPLVRKIWASSFNNCYSVFFNKNGKAVKENFWYRVDGQVDTRNTSVFSYDSKQNLIEKIDSISYGNESELFKKQNFKYDKNGLIELKSIHMRDKKREKISTFSYKGTNAKIKTVEIDFETGEIIKTTNQILNINGEINKDAATETREFDKFGNLIRVSIRPAIVIEPRFTILFNYDNNNNLIQKVVFDENNEFSSQESNFYDLNGKLKLKIDEWSGSITREYFDSLGQLLKSQKIYYVDSLGSNTEVEYKYDESNNLIYQKNIYKENHKLEVTERKYKLKYDAKGNWIEKRHFEGDSLTFIDRRDLVYY